MVDHYRDPIFIHLLSDFRARGVRAAPFPPSTTVGPCSVRTDPTSIK
jgi:hypothetical protein